jgi:hypothetical protein
MPRGLICECIKFDTCAIVSLCVIKINRIENKKIDIVLQHKQHLRPVQKLNKNLVM